MRDTLVVGIVALLSLAMVIASFSWALEAEGKWVWVALASLFIALFSFFFNVSGSVYLTEGERLENNLSRPGKEAGKVAVAIPVFRPGVELLGKCIRSLKKLEWGGKFEIFVLDDTDEPGHAERVKKLCGEEKVGHLHRKTREGGKAGALNAFLKKTDADFIAIFDADEIVSDSYFFMETMGHFKEGKVAFVQTNKECGGAGLFEKAANYTNALFVNLIQPINTRKGVALFTGSCGVFRTKALKDVGGFPNSVIEDVAVSLRMLWKGWRGEHVPKVYAVGKEISSFQRFSGQHMRYIGGVTALLPEYARNIWRFPLEQKMVMVVHAFGLHYVSLVQLAACAIAVLAASRGVFPGEIASLAYLFSTLFTLLFLSRVYVGSVRVGFFAYLLNFSVVVPRMLASLNSVLGNRSFGKLGFIFSGLVQLAVSIGLFALSWETGSVAAAWWALLFLSNPLFLVLKR